MNKPIDWKIFRNNLFWSNVLCRALVVSNSGASPSWGWRHDDSGKLEGGRPSTVGGGGHLSTGKQTGAARPRLEVFEDGRWTLLPGLQSTIRALRTPSPMPPGLPSPKIIYWSTTWKAEHFKKSKTKTVNIKQIFLIGSSFGTLLYLYILTIHSFFHPCIYVIQMINLSNVPSSRLWKPPWNSSLRHILWNQSALILQKATVVV